MVRKLLIFGIGGILIAVIAFTALKPREKGVEVNAELVTAQTLTETVSASGRIQPQTKVNITSEVNGEIKQLWVKEGEAVRQGDLLIVIDTVKLRSALDQSRYALEEINARLKGQQSLLDQAKEEFERQDKLFKQNLTSETAFKEARYTYDNSRASYEAMQAQAGQLTSAYAEQRDNYRKTKITAPMNGIVTMVDCEVGEIAAAQTSFTQGKTLMVISNLNVFEVEVDVDETEVNKISIGQPARIEVDAFPDTSYAGSVIEIGNTAITTGSGTTEQSTEFKVKVIFEDSNVAIRPGMSATVDITTETRTGALALPFSSVVMRSYDMDSILAARSGATTAATSGGVNAAPVAAESSHVTDVKRKEIKGVFVIRGGKAEFVPIETGIADQKFIEVMRGVVKGDSVIAGPYSALRTVKDGEEVRTAKESDEKDKS